MANEKPEKPPPTTADATPKAKAKTVRLRYQGAENVVAVVADQIVVQHTPQLFTLSIYQTAIPVDEQDALQVEELSARCIIRLVLTPSLMEQTITALQTNWQNFKTLKDYLEKHGEPPEDAPEGGKE